MKKILHLIFLFAGSTVFAQFTSIPDVNFENKLINLGIDSGSPDGKVLTSTINKLTNLDISNSGIISLTGIEGFVALTDLYCSFNQLVSLDITKNLALTYLDCGSNQLTALDLSKNTALNILYCDLNQLTALDLSKNAALTYLDCSSNALQSLNLKNGNNLNLDSIHSSFLNNPNLSCIQVDNKGFSVTNWASIKDDGTASYSENCSQYTLIPDVNFENALIALGYDTGTTDGKVLTSNINTQTSLDVQNSSIMSLIGIKDFIALKELYCNDNQLLSLDVTQNVALTYLNCSYNQLPSLNVTKNTALLFLDCDSNQIATLDLSLNTALNILYCNLNQITALDLSKNIALTFIDCSDNKLKSLNIKNGNNLNLDSFNSSFLNNSDLSCIQVDDKVFSDNNWAGLKDIGTASYSENCSQFTAIPDLNFENALINFGYDTGTADGKVLTSNINTITSLDVYSSNITNLTGIQDFVALTSLDCSINQLQSLDVTKNIALTDLHCDGNLLTFLDLSKNTSLTYINCSDNKLKGVNLKNGNYLNLDYVNSSFLNNPDFTCIQVDNKIYSDTNWSNIKEPTASYNEICVNLSTEKQVFENIAIYPNPTKDLLYLDNIVIEKVSIYDSSGHLVKTKTFTSGSTRNSVDFSGLSIGLYYAYISSEGVTSVRKIMVK